MVTRKELQLAKFQAKMQNGVVQAWHFPKNYEVQTGLKITLDQTPKDSTEVNIYSNITKKRIDSANYTIAGKVVTFTSGVAVGENALVTSFQYDVTADYADIGSEDIPSVVSIIVKKPLFDTNDTIVAYKQYFFPKCKMDLNVTLKGETEKKKTTEDTTFTVMKSDAYNYLGRIMFIPADSEDIDATISNLVATGGTAQAVLTFSAPAGATSVTLMYKKSADATYSNVTVGGSTGVRIASALTASSTGATVLGLDSTTAYNFKLVVVGGTYAGDSNIATATTL